MKRVTSRQRLVYHDAFEASVMDNDNDDSDYETCYESSMSRPSSFVSLPLALESPSMENLVVVEPNDDVPTFCRKRSRGDEPHPVALLRKNVSFSSNAPPTVQAPTPVPQWVPAFDFEIVSRFSLLADLMDDVQLHVVSFLEVQEARAVAATCHILRQLLFSQEALHLWKTWCLVQWPMLSNFENLEFWDDCHLPTALHDHHGSFHPNLSLLLGMSSSVTLPTHMDASLLRSTRLVQTPGMPGLRALSEPLVFRTYDKDDLPVVQFTGAVGTGDRCIRSNQPLPRPQPIKSLACYETDQKHGKSMFFNMIRGIHPKQVHAACRPLVAPFCVQDKYGDKMQIHVTPRMVNYFEITILQKELENDAAHNNNDTTTYPSDCVAIGIASEKFGLHSKMPGWDVHSYGYHGDDGGIFHASGEMIREFGPSFGPGDTVGCGMDYSCGGIFFTLNGEFLGYAWTRLNFEKDNMYATVGVDTNCPIASNFGQVPFEFDLQPLVKSHGEIVERALSPLTRREYTGNCQVMV